MKHLLIFLLLACMQQAFTGCHPNNAAVPARNSGQTNTAAFTAGTLPAPGVPYSRSLSPDSANRMIRSYLHAVDYTVNTEALRAWFFDADTLRAFLQNKQIKHLKFFLAHTAEYAFSENEGTLPPLNSHVLTFVLAGVDENNHYIYSDEGGPYDFAFPCPPRCPTPGDTLVYP